MGSRWEQGLIGRESVGDFVGGTEGRNKEKKEKLKVDKECFKAVFRIRIRIRIHRIYMFWGLPDPDPSEVWIRIRIHLSLSKYSKKNLDFYCFVTSF